MVSGWWHIPLLGALQIIAYGGLVSRPILLKGIAHTSSQMTHTRKWNRGSVTEPYTHIQNLKHKEMHWPIYFHKISSVAQSCLNLCDPMDCSTPGFPVHHQLPELAQTHVHLVGDAIQPPHPLSSASPAFNLAQHQSLFKWVSSFHQVAKVLELQLQHQSFQWRMRWEIVQED